MKPNQNGTFKLNTSSSITNYYVDNFNPNSTTSISSSYYSQGKIVNTDIFEDRIEIIYKCERLVTTYPGDNYPKIYKEVYSRIDGSMQKIDGTYIPEQHYEETYEF